jgi:hypothetical protein
MTCPVTLNCYKVVKEVYVDSGSYTFLNDDLHETFLEAKQHIEDDAPTVQTQALRAFYALEYMYFYLLPHQIRSSEHLHWKHNFQEQFERSCEGLDVLIRLCEQTARRIVVDKGTLALMQREKNDFKKVTMDKPVWLIGAIKEAAELLRKHMAGSSVSLGCVGEQLGYALTNGNQSLDRCIQVLQTINSISIHNPVSPCNMTRKFQG